MRRSPGAEWRFGTVTTVLTWEPRRLRLHLARTASAGILAFIISFLVQVAFLASFLPAVLANGTTAGADADWWLQLLEAMTRVSLLTAGAAVLAVALATLGRNTAFALAAVFAWFAVVEGVATRARAIPQGVALGREPGDRLHLGAARGRRRHALTRRSAGDCASLCRGRRRRRRRDLPSSRHRGRDLRRP